MDGLGERDHEVQRTWEEHMSDISESTQRR